MKALPASASLPTPLSQLGDHTVVIGNRLRRFLATTRWNRAQRAGTGNLSEVVLDLTCCCSVLAYCFLAALREDPIGSERPSFRRR
jgi:hypothetical protein